MKKWTEILGIALILALFIPPGCKQGSRSQSPHNLPSGVTILEEQNGLITGRSLAFHYQDIFNPRLAQLKTQEGLDDVISSGKSELDKMRLLRDWVSRQWESSIPDPYPVWDAVTILKEIRAGRTGGFCAQYAVLLVQSCLSLGWQARYLAIARDARPDNGHMTVEIWSNQFMRWVVMDPYFCVDYEKDGIPLSALDIHQSLVNGDSGRIEIKFGKDSRSNSPGKTVTRETLLSYYFHLAVSLRNDHLSRSFNFWNRHQEYLSFKDNYTDGRMEIFSLYTTEENEFNFPVNQVEMILFATREPNTLVCRLRTNMPGAKALLIKPDGGDWQHAGLGLSLDRLYGSVLVYHWRIHPGENTLRARAVNELGVKGPVSHIRIHLKP